VASGSLDDASEPPHHGLMARPVSKASLGLCRLACFGLSVHMVACSSCDPCMWSRRGYEADLASESSEVDTLIRRNPPPAIDLPGGADPTTLRQLIITESGELHAEEVRCARAMITTPVGAHFCDDGTFPQDAPALEELTGATEVTHWASSPSVTHCDAMAVHVAERAPAERVAEALTSLRRARAYAVVRTTSGMRAHPFLPPVAARPPRSGDEQLSLRLVFRRDGIVVRGSGGDMAPGCAGLPESADTRPTVLNADGERDWAEVRRCLEKIKDVFPDDTMLRLMISEDTTSSDVIGALLTTQTHADRDLFYDTAIVMPTAADGG
jgi:hypothetical protein